MIHILYFGGLTLWWFNDPKQLSSQAREIISDIENIVLVSSVSTWEIVIKKSLGKLQVPDVIFELIDKENFLELPITIAHTKILSKLPRHHEDPFDRLLIAQAILGKAALITRDKVIEKYPITVIRA